MNPLRRVWSRGRAAVADVKRSNENKATAAVALFAILVAFALVRRGGLPDERGFAALAGATIVVILLAQVLPEPVTLLLGVAVLVTVVQDGGATLTRLIDRGVDEFQGALARAA